MFRWMNLRDLLIVSVLLAAAGCAEQVTFPGTTVVSITTPAATEPVDPAEPARVAVIGDFGIGSTEQYAVAASIQAMAESEGLDALITTGDNFYNDDIERIWVDAYSWVADDGLAVYAAWGNHDIATQKRADLVGEYLSPPYWWYTVELGAATLIALDSNQVESEEQRSWLEATLAATDGLTIVSFHSPAFSCGKRGSTGSIIERWVPLFEQYGVDLVLNGHDHDYERFGIDGITYIVTGGGGQPIRPTRSCGRGTPPSITANDSDNHYVLVEIEENAIAVTAIAVDGRVIDRTVVGDE